MLEMMLGSLRKTDVKIKKALVGTTSCIALTESGRLYCRGSVGFLRGLGSSETLTDAWYLIDDGVLNFYTTYTSGMVYRKTNNTWWATGSVNGFGANAINASIKKDITVNFSAIPVDADVVKYVAGSHNSMLLMSNGDVYNVGYATQGALGTRSSTGDVLIYGKLLVGAGTGFPDGTKFSDIAVSPVSSTAYFITTDNSIYALGNAVNYAMGSNNSNSVNRIAVGLGGGSFTGIHAGNYCYYYAIQNRMVSGVGNYYYGQIGGAKYPGDYSTGTGIPTSIMTGGIGTTVSVYTAPGRIWIENNGQWWYTGAQTYGVGSTTALTRGTPANITAGMGGDFTGAIISSCDTGFNNTLAIKDGVLYGCGYNNGYSNHLAPIPKDGNSMLFIKLDTAGITA